MQRKKIKDPLWERVEKEFPKNPTMQHVHYARLKIQEKTKGMSSEEYIQFIKSEAKKALGKK